MKTIFLDIDGCLNHENFYRGKSKFPRRNELYLSELDRASILILNSIIQATDAKVVISSTWRVHHDPPEILDFLKEQGFIGEIVGVTPHLTWNGAFRGNEIYLWMEKNEELIGKRYKYKNYVILDDDSDMLYWQRKNFIHVDGHIGLSERDAKKAIRILNDGEKKVAFNLQPANIGEHENLISNLSNHDFQI
jgi:Swiss Army Knife RNA repair-like protein